MSPDKLVAKAAEAEANMNLPAALAAYEEALQLAPDSLDIALRLASLAFRLEFWDMAEKLYAHLITSGLHQTLIISSYAASLREQSKFDEAVDVLKTVLNQMPDQSPLWEGLGSVMLARKDTDNALTFFNEALRLEPDNLHARFNRGCAFMDKGDTSSALEDFTACANAFDDPGNHASAQIAYAQTLLSIGNLTDGWKAYEAREQYGTPKQVHYHIWSRRWREDQPLAGRNLLISGEQGLGDEILFASALPEVIRDIGPHGSVTLGVEPRLVPLFQRSFPTASVVAHRTQSVDGILQRSYPDMGMTQTDGWALMGDFLATYRGQLDEFPVQNAYLKPDPARVMHWRGQMSKLSAKPKIGILWKSLKFSAERDRYFSPFDDWREILSLDQFDFFSLQYGDCREEIARAAEEGLTLHTPAGIDLKDDLDDLAALCQAMDLIIAPSNATSNIAAACGVPVWMIQYGGWLQLGQTYHPWYPSVRIFSPPSLSDWRPAFQAIRTALLDQFDGRKEASKPLN
ncbi:hypothetical protein AEAC466_08890 [Asticcacaulis sp. AC466]|uniref:tetratricopeptide repeat protein n=1 Tax=Asticcacaulis sp. AC466 TaxID=1282362 RepID=UPI0003C3F5C3|nr:tetratricopeptide repeat protein [Asticcacaulis sp. AC466]ESQ84458.1 hypothetical protein AEAC466_08890 [Asticcacaulis sp. AC466]